jgi:CHAT domain-containing protein
VVAEEEPSKKSNGASRGGPIKSTTLEAKHVIEILRSKAIQVHEMVNTKATIQDVIRGLKDAHLFHISSHGNQDMKNPLESHFVLHDEDLTIEQIKNADTPNALFAFLSACETATGDIVYLDQAVHLAASLLWCGFCGVLATMWYVR